MENKVQDHEELAYTHRQAPGSYLWGSWQWKLGLKHQQLIYFSKTVSKISYLKKRFQVAFSCWSWSLKPVKFLSWAFYPYGWSPSQ